MRNLVLLFALAAAGGFVPMEVAAQQSASVTPIADVTFSMRTEIANGADFVEMARKHSEEKSSAQKGGDLGFLTKGHMMESIDAAAFSLKKPGELSPPVRTPLGYHIVQLVEHKPLKRKSLEDIQGDVRNQLLDKLNAETRAKTWAAAEADAKVDEAAIKALVEREARR